MSLNTQHIRLADVLLLGPFLIYAGLKSRLSRADKILLVIAGIGTILYNGIRYLNKSKD